MDLIRTNTLTAFTASSDTDGDGASDRNEHFANTNPKDASDKLVTTDYLTAPGETLTTLTWETNPTRLYSLQKNSNLGTSLWLDSGLGLLAPDGASTTRAFADTNAPMRFHRVRAVRPLAP